MLSSTATRKEMILFGQRRSVLPSRGVLGGSLLLVLLVLYFVVFDGFRAHPKGMDVLLSVPQKAAVFPTVIGIRQDKDYSTRYYLNGKSVPREALTSTLRAKLDSTAQRFVCVEADMDTRYEDVVYAVDSAVEVGVQVLILPPKACISGKY